MKLHISFQLKFDTEAQADTAVNYVNNNYGTYLIKLVKKDLSAEKIAGTFPSDWGVYCILTFQASQFIEHKNMFGNLIDNHADKIFNFSANTSHELED